MTPRSTFDLSLYLVTDQAMCARLGLERVVAEAVAGGVTMVQLRDDAMPAAELIELASRVRALLAPAGVPLIVNNRVEVALAAGAEGAHVGQGDLPPADARRRLGPTAILGLSITHPDQLAHVDAELVDYLGVGPVAATATKPDAAPPIGVGGLAAVCAAARLPVVAIGGLGPANAAAAIRAGAAGIAVVSAVCAAPDPRAAAAELVGSLMGAPRPAARTSDTGSAPASARRKVPGGRS